jgi:hypothetical protein
MERAGQLIALLTASAALTVAAAVAALTYGGVIAW